MNYDRSKKKGRGGARPGAGRPAPDPNGEPRNKRIRWMLTAKEHDALMELLKRMREGNAGDW